MKIKEKGVTPVTVGRSDSGNYEYRDTGKIVNVGDQAFLAYDEDTITGAKTKVFFEKKESAEKFN